MKHKFILAVCCKVQFWLMWIKDECILIFLRWSDKFWKPHFRSVKTIRVCLIVKTWAVTNKYFRRHHEKKGKKSSSLLSRNNRTKWNADDAEPHDWPFHNISTSKCACWLFSTTNNSSAEGFPGSRIASCSVGQWDLFPNCVKNCGGNEACVTKKRLMGSSLYIF